MTITNTIRVPGPATRDAYGEALVELGRLNPAVVVLDADLSKSTKSNGFAKAFPDRFINVGIAEANMVSMAAGLANFGLIPFASSFASFLMAKSFDQLRMGIANPRVNAKFVGSHGGISLGEDGASQQSVEDIALAVALPHMAVLVPADAVAARALTFEAAAHDGPVFLRTGRPKAAMVYAAETPFPVGGSHTLRIGRDLTIIANGLMVHEALCAAEQAEAQGLSVGVIDAYCVKPLDATSIVKAARESGALLVVEEHLSAGALGAAVAQVCAEQQPVPMAFIGLKDTYAESGRPEALLAHFGLDANGIAAAIPGLLARKQALMARA